MANDQTGVFQIEQFPAQSGLMGKPPSRATTEDGKPLISYDGRTWTLDYTAPRLSEQSMGWLAERASAITPQADN